MGDGRIGAIYPFDYRGRRFEIRRFADGTLELCLDGVVRKRRPPSGEEPVYLWTNVELQWEEHHFIEVRYWPSSGRLLITANGHVIHDGRPLASAVESLERSTDHLLGAPP